MVEFDKSREIYSGLLASWCNDYVSSLEGNMSFPQQNSPNLVCQKVACRCVDSLMPNS